jgi:glycosyltransferase involved in cell wall biosynthesis
VIHIAWLGKKSPFCGNVTYSLTTTEALRQRGHQVSFIHFDTPTGPSFQRPDLITTRPRVASSGGLRALAQESPEVTLPYLVKSQVYTIPSPGALRELRESLERLRPDVVHASLTLSPLDFRLPDLCQHLGLPLVATFHPAFDANLRNITAGTQQLTYQVYAPSLARYDRVIVFSELQADLLERLGVPQNRLAVIPNGVDINTWTPAPASSARQLSDLRQRFGGHRVFLYMGRLSTEKNVEALLKAWRLVRPEGCLLLIVGDGPLRSALQHNEADVLWWGYEGDLQRRCFSSPPSWRASPWPCWRPWPVARPASPPTRARMAKPWKGGPAS